MVRGFWWAEKIGRRLEPQIRSAYLQVDKKDRLENWVSEWREKTADNDALNVWRQFSDKKTIMQKLHNGKNAKRFPFWNTIANHGAQYPISSFKADPPAINKILRICRHSRQSVVSNPSAWRMGESRICYVGTKESLLMYSVWILTIWTVWSSADGHSSLPGGKLIAPC